MSTQSDNALIREQASAWLAELHDGMPSAESVAAFDAWMEESPDHADVYFELSESYYQLDAIDPKLFESNISAGNSPDAAAANVVPLTKSRDSHTHTYTDTRTPNNSTSGFSAGKVFRSFAVAASVAAVFVLSQSFLHVAADLSTSTGEIALHELPDASSAHLNSNTQINVVYSEDQRGLDLLRGEAYFTVAKDAARPFIVRTNGTQVKALGTEFVVHNRDGYIQVAVYESSVEVSHADYLTHPIVVSAGERLEFGPEQRFEGKQSLDIADGAAWRDGKLVFKATPLQDVVAILKEHHSGKIVLSKELNDLPISGVFNKIEPTRILRDIAETQNLETLSVGDKLLYIYQ